MAPPVPAVPTLALPAVMRAPVRIVGAGAVLQRSTATTLALHMVAQEVRRTLRFEMGAAYNVTPFYQLLTGDAAWVGVISDLSSTRAEETVRRYLGVLQGCAEQRLSEERLEQYRTASIAALDSPGWEVQLADLATSNTLLGARPATRAELHDEHRLVSSDAIRAVASQLISSALYQVPAGLDVAVGGATPLPDWSSWTATGVEFEDERLLPSPRERFTLDERGMTVRVGEHARSIEWQQTAAMQCWADGGRRIIGKDGSEIVIVPTRVRRGRELVEHVDAKVPTSLYVPQAKRMCPPVGPPIRRDPAVRRRWTQHVRTVRAVAVGLGVLVFMCLGDVVHSLEYAGGGSRTDLPAMLQMLGIAVAVALLVVGISARRRWREVSVGGGSGGVETYDLAAAHRKRLPEGVPVTRSYVRGGHLLAFVALHDLVSSWFRQEARDSIDRLTSRTMTGPELYEEWDGILASDMLSDEGNAFLFELLRVRPKHGSRYKRLLEQGGHATYDVAPTWEAYDGLAPRLETELSRWRNRRHFDRILRTFQAPPIF